MSTKMYNIVAGVLARANNQALELDQEMMRRELARCLAYEFEKENPRFCRDRFLAASEV